MKNVKRVFQGPGSKLSNGLKNWKLQFQTRLLELTLVEQMLRQEGQALCHTSSAYKKCLFHDADDQFCK